MTRDKDLQIKEELDMLYLVDPTRGTMRMANELRKRALRGPMSCTVYDRGHAIKNGLFQATDHRDRSSILNLRLVKSCAGILSAIM